MNTCSVAECESAHLAKGLCSRHYKRMRSHGDPLGGEPDRPAGRTAEERFWAKVDTSGDCWDWTGGKTAGYGVLLVNGKSTLAHRISFELGVGEIPQRLVIDHKCRNRSCVNPSHLQAVTYEENNQNLSGAQARNPSGIRGVQLDSSRKSWVVRVRHRGRLHYGGRFSNREQAEVAAINLRNQLFTNNLKDRKAA